METAQMPFIANLIEDVFH